MDLSGDLYLEWERYVSSLYPVGLHLSEVEEILVWSYNSMSRHITTKLAYGFIVDNHLEPVDCWWHKEF